MVILYLVPLGRSHISTLWLLPLFSASPPPGLFLLDTSCSGRIGAREDRREIRRGRRVFFLLSLSAAAVVVIRSHGNQPGLVIIIAT